jgi:hypothetical protein
MMRERYAMPPDLPLTAVAATLNVADKLADAAIRTVRQLYDRLRSNPAVLRTYLQLPGPAFNELYRQVEDLIRTKYPEDLQPKGHPEVNRTGVPVHRHNDPSRPRYDPDFAG